MKKSPMRLGLSKEAFLLDSRLYIVKAVFAIATGFVIGMGLPVARLDMISVLLGVMYNLEPINIIGVKGGINQLVASTLGAACTGILVILFGINVFTISISMALTLYVSLKINWRAVSPVAIFTCIYMTQFVQTNSAGDPSIWLTFRLRIVALGVGVLIAIIFNYIFSFLYYKRIAYKRLQFAKLQLLAGLDYTEKQLRGQCRTEDREYISLFPSIFNDLDLVYTNIDLMINEAKYSFKLLQIEELKVIQRILQYFRDINHLAYDINYVIDGEGNCDGVEASAVNSLGTSIKVLKEIDFMWSKMKRETLEKDKKQLAINSDCRVSSDIILIEKYIKLIAEETSRT